MPNSSIPRAVEQIILDQTRSEFQRRSRSEVRQDKCAPVSMRSVSDQPAAVTKSRHMVKEAGKNSDRVKKHPRTAKAVQVWGWVEPGVKASDKWTVDWRYADDK